VVAHLADIDEALTAAAENWRLPRMAAVDRNVLRLAAYELRHATETPPNVVFDEAIKLARRYGSADSPAFVNGVPDRGRPPTPTACPIPARQPFPALCQLAARRSRSGLAAVAVTDHDTLEGVAPAQQAAVGTGVEVVPAVE